MHWAGRRAPISTRATEIIEEAQPSPQAQGRDHHAQEDRILQEVMPQIMRRSDCEIWYNYVHSRYKASIYVNGQKIQDLFDFSLQELKESLRLEIKQLDATSGLLLTSGGPVNRVHVILRSRLFRYKQLKRKTLFLLAQYRTFDQIVCSEGPVMRITCFESQDKYYKRLYCHLVCRQSTLKFEGMCNTVIQF